MGTLTGKVAIISGAAQGIGAAYARRLAQDGAKVFVCDLIDPAKTVEEIRAAGGEAMGCVCDITDVDSVTEMVASAEREFGGVHILINNAAIFGALPLKPFMEITSNEWDMVMRINTRGPFECVKAVVPVMKRQGYGKIVNVTSSGVFKGIPMLLHYIASKAAVIGMTRSMARELGDSGIRVNVIAPGLTMSEQIKDRSDYELSRNLNLAGRAIKRDQVPDDLVGAVSFLASPDSDFMTGQTLLVDGGSAMI